MKKGLDAVKKFIVSNNINAKILEFEISTETVSKAASAAGIHIENVLKTLLMKSDKGLLAIMVCGERKVDYNKVKKFLKIKKIRFLKPEEIELYTPFEVGGVSPLFSKIYDFHIILDEQCLENNYVTLGGGDNYHLVEISLRDLVNVLNPQIADVSK